MVLRARRRLLRRLFLSLGPRPAGPRGRRARGRGGELRAGHGARRLPAAPPRRPRSGRGRGTEGPAVGPLHRKAGGSPDRAREAWAESRRPAGNSGSRRSFSRPVLWGHWPEHDSGPLPTSNGQERSSAQDQTDGIGAASPTSHLRGLP